MADDPPATRMPDKAPDNEKETAKREKNLVAGRKFRQRKLEMNEAMEAEINRLRASSSVWVVIQMPVDCIDHGLVFLAKVASLQWRAPKLILLTKRPTLSSLLTEMLDKIFLLAILDDVCIERRKFVLVESAYMWWSPKWACDLLASSRGLRALIGWFLATHGVTEPLPMSSHG
ncbi:uncharacterized protein AB675_2009 [Cyphellophora attinorum]|uniref:BZIP domain-containing protein n=1 Tax=Cyphellophora attinorum TaxID=1664694 RepID=A0A0N1HCX4_9EURO|nr:uncharacterized protein AB675_2009 [Phialophora attinorum]KPI42692.1 hypothetical protein AB675_2009 [Phialophora attinorum]